MPASASSTTSGATPEGQTSSSSLKAWDQTFRTRSWGRYPSEAVIRAFASVPRQSTVLDLGCGPGAHCWFLAREGFDTYAIDGSPAALEQAKKRMTAEGQDVIFSLGDISKPLPYKDGTFDAVLDSAAIACLTTTGMANCLGDVHRILKSGGRIISIGFTTRTTREIEHGALKLHWKELSGIYGIFKNQTFQSYTWISEDGTVTENFALSAIKL